MTELPHNWPEIARQSVKDYKKKLEKISKVKNAEKVLFEAHDRAFSKIDCLNCANCCKTLGPRFNTTDISRISKHLRLKESIFIEQYLKVDEDSDYVAKSLPCPFLGPDNYCGIYDVRPTDCKNYPYTNKDIFFKKPQISLFNAQSCPAAFLVMEEISGKV